MTDPTIHSPLPEGYKHSEVGVIPEEWEVKTISDLGSFSKGHGIKRNDISEDGVSCIRYGEIYTIYNYYVTEPESKIPLNIAMQSQKIQKGDLLFTGSGETVDEIGKCIAYLGEEPAYAGGDIIILSPKQEFSLFLCYLLNSPIIVDQKARLGQGDAVAHINAKNLGSIKIPLPSIVEQRAIAGVLSDVDAWLTALDKLIAKKRAVKQAAMQDLLTGRVRLPGFSGEWKVRKLGEIGGFRGGSGFPVVYQGDMNGKYPFFKVSDMNREGNEIFLTTSANYISEETRQKIGSFVFPQNSIVFAKIGAAIFLERKKILARPSCIDNNMMGFIVDNSAIQYKFMYYLLLTIKLGQLVSTTALPALNSNELATLEFRFPNPAEQRAIAGVLSDMDAEIEALERQRAKGQALKQGLMQELLTGRIRLRTAQKSN